jgi:hypothetical protein
MTTTHYRARCVFKKAFRTRAIAAMMMIVALSKTNPFAGTTIVLNLHLKSNKKGTIVC